jgi:hypothetical protein
MTAVPSLKISKVFAAKVISRRKGNTAAVW